ncbi:hypothetical protein DIPPA_17863 [Diplonema papillatum]|nr:hypothetical protein DIPPA_17863 [Diplonema papillatum]
MAPTAEAARPRHGVNALGYVSSSSSDDDDDDIRADCVVSIEMKQFATTSPGDRLLTNIPSDSNAAMGSSTNTVPEMSERHPLGGVSKDPSIGEPTITTTTAGNTAATAVTTTTTTTGKQHRGGSKRKRSVAYSAYVLPSSQGVDLGKRRNKLSRGDSSPSAWLPASASVAALDPPGPGARSQAVWLLVLYSHALSALSVCLLAVDAGAFSARKSFFERHGQSGSAASLPLIFDSALLLSALATGFVPHFFPGLLGDRAAAAIAVAYAVLLASVGDGVRCAASFNPAANVWVFSLFPALFAASFPGGEPAVARAAAAALAAVLCVLLWRGIEEILGVSSWPACGVDLPVEAPQGDRVANALLRVVAGVALPAALAYYSRRVHASPYHVVFHGEPSPTTPSAGREADDCAQPDRALESPAIALPLDQNAHASPPALSPWGGSDAGGRCRACRGVYPTPSSDAGLSFNTPGKVDDDDTSSSDSSTPSCAVETVHMKSEGSLEMLSPVSKGVPLHSGAGGGGGGGGGFLSPSFGSPFPLAKTKSQFSVGSGRSACPPTLPAVNLRSKAGSILVVKLAVERFGTGSVQVRSPVTNNIGNPQVDLSSAVSVVKSAVEDVVQLYDGVFAADTSLYNGDLVVTWNLTKPHPQHVLQACNAAISLKEQLEDESSLPRWWCICVHSGTIVYEDRDSITRFQSSANLDRKNSVTAVGGWNIVRKALSRSASSFHTLANNSSSSINGQSQPHLMSPVSAGQACKESPTICSKEPGTSPRDHAKESNKVIALGPCIATGRTFTKLGIQLGCSCIITEKVHDLVTSSVYTRPIDCVSISDPDFEEPLENSIVYELFHGKVPEEQPPSQLSPTYMQAFMFFKQGNYSRAKERLMTYLPTAPRDTQAMRLLRLTLWLIANGGVVREGRKKAEEKDFKDDDSSAAGSPLAGFSIGRRGSMASLLSVTPSVEEERQFKREYISWDDIENRASDIPESVLEELRNKSFPHRNNTGPNAHGSAGQGQAAANPGGKPILESLRDEGKNNESPEFLFSDFVVESPTRTRSMSRRGSLRAGEMGGSVRSTHATMLKTQIQEAEVEANAEALSAWGVMPSNSGDTAPKAKDVCSDPHWLPRKIDDTNGMSWMRSSKQIGRGAFADVWLGMAHDGALAAIKTMKLPDHSSLIDDLASPTKALSSKERRTRRSMKNRGGAASKSAKVETIDGLVSEVSLMENLRHENIVSYLGSTVVSGHIFIVMEYLSGGSLADVLQQFDTMLPKSSIVRYITDILRGLCFLHRNKIIHRDMKPQNILVLTTGECKLADFGASAELGALAETNQGLIGTPLYMAPEACSGAACQASDVWSLGIIVCQLYTGQVPYSFVNSNEFNPHGFMYKLSSTADFSPTIPPSLPTLAQAFVEACFERDPNERASANALQSHPFILD